MRRRHADHGGAQKNRDDGASSVAKKNRAETDRLGEQSAEKWAQREAEIVDAVKAAQDPAALILAREIDAGHFPCDDPNTLADADHENQNQDHTEPGRDAGQQSG